MGRIQRLTQTETDDCSWNIHTHTCIEMRRFVMKEGSTAPNPRTGLRTWNLPRNVYFSSLGCPSRSCPWSTILLSIIINSQANKTHTPTTTPKTLNYYHHYFDLLGHQVPDAVHTTRRQVFIVAWATERQEPSVSVTPGISSSAAHGSASSTQGAHPLNR